uniref:Conserved oligomeric Golgi complex subunit 8 n=1 Tax=Strongyloides venezuelensis TaxID=75913 RepID=A0A0K0G129_STRVS
MNEYVNWSYNDLKNEKLFLSHCWDNLKESLNQLAFSNYKTYADASRTSQECTTTITQLDDFLRSSSSEINHIINSVKEFSEKSKEIYRNFDTLKKLHSPESVGRQLISLPKMMDDCVREGQYESAYMLTKLGLDLTRNRLTEKPIVKAVAETLMESRHKLLDELFNKFAFSIDLATSIKVISSIKQIPFVTTVQMKVSLLQYRDLYLDKLLANIIEDQDFYMKMIDVFRDCIHDTIVLYISVFPDRVVSRKNENVKWEQWNKGSQTFLLHSWALHNIDRMFENLNNIERNKNLIDIEAIYMKLVSCASSFARIGLDFRNTVSNKFNQIMLKYIFYNIDICTVKLTSATKLNIVGNDENFENATKPLIENEFLALHLNNVKTKWSLYRWDDGTVYTNEIIAIFNDMRHFLLPSNLNSIIIVLKNSFRQIFEWLDNFIGEEYRNNEPLAGVMFVREVIPYIEMCLQKIFPYDSINNLYNGEVDRNEYETFLTLFDKECLKNCKNAEYFERIYYEENNKNEVKDENEV